MIYGNFDDTYKKTTVIFIFTTTILFIAFIILLKINIGYKNTIKEYGNVVNQAKAQITESQNGTIELTNEYNKAVSDLNTANSTIESQKKEIEILNKTLDDYKNQISSLQNSISGQYQTPQQNITTENKQTKSSMSIPSLEINQNNESSASPNVVTID